MSPSASAAAQPVRDLHRWIKDVQAGIKRTVTIVDNGGEPFVVKLTSLRGPGTAHVWRMKDGRYNDGKVREKWRSIAYEQVFVGIDPSEKSSKQKVWWHGGNTLLLKTADKQYVCIMDEIFAFKTSDDIVKYVSIMGNSAVPYPFAVGSHNTYLFVEKAYVPNEYMKQLGLGTATKDPYEIYYTRNMITGAPSRPQGPGSVVSRKARADYARAHQLKGLRILHHRI